MAKGISDGNSVVVVIMAAAVVAAISAAGTTIKPGLGPLEVSLRQFNIIISNHLFIPWVEFLAKGVSDGSSVVVVIMAAAVVAATSAAGTAIKPGLGPVEVSLRQFNIIILLTIFNHIFVL